MSSSGLLGEQTQQQQSTGHWVSAWLPVMICIAAIATESTQAFGADHTSGPLQRLLESLLHRHFTQPEWWRLHIIIRKCGHFFGYGILSLAWFRAFRMSLRPAMDLNRRLISCHLLAMLGTFFIASCDEFHQVFLPNRSGSFVDVLVDCSGAAFLQLLLWLFMRRQARARQIAY